MSKETYENPDLKKERQNCPFNKEEITFLLDGGKEKTDERRQLGKIFKHQLIIVILTAVDAETFFKLF